MSGMLWEVITGQDSYLVRMWIGSSIWGYTIGRPTGSVFFLLLSYLVPGEPFRSSLSFAAPPYSIIDPLLQTDSGLGTDKGI